MRNITRLQREADTAVGCAAHAWMIATAAQGRANVACDAARAAPSDARAQVDYSNALTETERARQAADDADAVVLRCNRRLMLV